MLFSDAFLCVSTGNNNEMECKQFNEFWEAHLHYEYKIKKTKVTTMLPICKFSLNKEMSLERKLSKLFDGDIDVKIVNEFDEKSKI